MTCRAIAKLVALLLAGGSLLIAPALTSASSGGAGIQGKRKGTRKKATNSKVQPGNVRVTASGNGITIASRASGFLGNDLHFSGGTNPSAAGSTVEIDRRGARTRWTWVPTAHGRVHRNGSFSISWHVNHIGRFSFRALIKGHGTSHAASASPGVVITVYRPAVASWFGPESWGSTTACGETLEPNMLGVAHRTLPCGTPVAIYYQGKTIVVPVVDRGPYVEGRDWDLTKATSDLLGMTDAGVATIWTVSLPR